MLTKASIKNGLEANYLKRKNQNFKNEIAEMTINGSRTEDEN